LIYEHSFTLMCIGPYIVLITEE